MKTNKYLLEKSVKSFLVTIIFMFSAPLVLHQAFKNRDHPWFIPVLIVGIVCTILAIGYGFRSVKIMMDAVFGEKNKIHKHKTDF